MRVTITTDIARTIFLNKEEAEYLANLTRNYLGYGEENVVHRDIREKFFKCVTRNVDGVADYGVHRT